MKMFWTFNQVHRRTKKTGSSAFWPFDVLSNPDVVETAVRNKISVTAAKEFTASLIRATQADPNKISLSYTTSYRYRADTVQDLAFQIKQKWKPSPILALHWDWKLMKSLEHGPENDERLPVLVSGVNGVKMLGVPVLKHEKGAKIGPELAATTLDLLDDWKCKDQVRAMVFDTTASNTGSLTAACVSVQNILERELLWLPCRRHIGERILAHCWECLNIEPSSGPQTDIFKNFKNGFSKLQYTKYSLFIPKTRRSLRILKEEVIVLCKEALNKSFVRGDYKELVTLTLIYLGEAPANFNRFQVPGAISNARWMEKILYSMKIVLLSNQVESFKPVMLQKKQLEKLNEFVQFVVYCYIPWWIAASQTCSAPSNDLKLINTLKEYQVVQQNLSEVALKVVSNHMWYLSEELVPLVLFSTSVKADQKQRVADTMMSCQPTEQLKSLKRHGSGYGKPTFPEIPVGPAEDVSAFVGEDSWSFFRILGIDSSFIKKPVEEWCQLNGYLRNMEVINSLRVVNDAAERGVKLCSDFIGSAKKESKLQHILQVVENRRANTPNQRDSSVKSKSWFLTLE